MKSFSFILVAASRFIPSCPPMQAGGRLLVAVLPDSRLRRGFQIADFRFEMDGAQQFGISDLRFEITL